MIKRDYEVQKRNRMCCCIRQPQITDADLNRLAKDSSIQLRNLSNTFRAEVEGASSFDIREFFSESNVPFRYAGCSRGSLACCCCCTRLCNQRCPQDVMHRAYLFCGNILSARTPEEVAERYSRAELAVRLLYDELTSEHPRYVAISAMVTEMSTPVFNKKLEQYIIDTGGVESPYKMDYAPVLVYEPEQIEHPNGYIETRWRKKVDPETGNVAYIAWPGSGMCPFCLPTGLVDRRRKANTTRKRGKKNERGTDAMVSEKQNKVPFQF